jgi:hypothetical protein
MLLLAMGSASAQTLIGAVTHLSGTLLVKRGADTRMLSVKSEVYEGDILITQAGTYARFKFKDQGEIVMRPESQLEVTGYSYDEAVPGKDNAAMSLLKGGLRAVTGLIGQRNRDKYAVRTVTATIGIRGTHFGALMCTNDCGSIPTPSGGPPPNGLHVDVAQGAVSLTNQGGSQVVNAGQFAYVRDNVTPPVIQPPQQGIQVTMPAQISRNTASGRTVGAKREDMECTVQ